MLDSHLCLALLAVNNLGRDDFGGGGLRSAAYAFGLGDDHLSDGPGGGDDGRFGSLHRLQTLLSLKCTNHLVHLGLKENIHFLYSKTKGTLGTFQ